MSAITDYERDLQRVQDEYEKQTALEHAAAVDAGEVDPRAGKRSRLRRSTLNLRDLMTAQLPPADWVLWPFVERGQQAALVAPAKAGKSLIVLEAVLAAAEGRPTFGHPVTRPSKVLYLDAENTARDLQRRLHALEATDQALENIVYESFPELGALNTADGAELLLELVDAEAPDLIVIDTVSRFIEGDENTSGPWLDLYRLTLAPLKRRGIAVLRLDHTGKDTEKGARGSSAKRSDVDAEWSLTFDPAAQTRTLHRILVRSSDVPGSVVLAVLEDPLRHERDLSEDMRLRTVADVVKALDDAGANQAMGRDRVLEVLGAAGYSLTQRLAGDACAIRKQRPDAA